MRERRDGLDSTCQLLAQPVIKSGTVDTALSYSRLDEFPDTRLRKSTTPFRFDCINNPTSDATEAYVIEPNQVYVLVGHICYRRSSRRVSQV